MLHNLVTTNDCISMILCFWFVDRMNLSVNIVANTLLVLRYRLLIIWNLQVLVSFNITIIFGHWLSIKDTGWHYETLPAVLLEHWEQRKQCKYCWIGTYNWGNHKVLYNTAMHIFVIVCECLGNHECLGVFIFSLSFRGTVNLSTQDWFYPKESHLNICTNIVWIVTDWQHKPFPQTPPPPPPIFQAENCTDGG